jgi:hypothetical protein
MGRDNAALTPVLSRNPPSLHHPQAGYRMMSVVQPDLCRRVALRYTAALMPICMAAPLLGTCCFCTFASHCFLHPCFRPAASPLNHTPTHPRCHH